jgi:cell wall-associated NlpC family hydrolase
MMQIQEKFAQAAQDCLGARFRLQGRDPATGLDCVGLIVWCAQVCGLTVSHQPAYTLTSRPDALLRELEATGFQRQEKLLPTPGDVIVFNMDNALNHVAIATRNGMTHADMRFRRVVSHRIDDVWQARIAAIYSLTEK